MHARPPADRLEAMLAESRDRNRDNVARTQSYLDLYALCRSHGIDLPWVLMAHVVSRNAGYLMTDLAERPDSARIFTREALDELFLFLERPNFLIFHDAWRHVLHHLLGRTRLLGDETPRFVREAWARYERAAASGVTPAVERSLVLDLVTNEQNLIERRVVKSPRFERARAMIGFLEAIGAERPIVLPVTDAKIRVGGFARIEQRIETGRRIFDEVLASRTTRDAIFAWCERHPHTGSRAVYAPERPARTTPALRDVWPVDRVRAMWPGVHDPPEPDPAWP